MILHRFSELSQEHTLLIDNFNSDTNSLISIWNVDITRFYRVLKRNRNNNALHERYFSDVESAIKYFSQLMGEKTELF